jgi:PqqD family protein of HPr-rel-A system
METTLRRLTTSELVVFAELGDEAVLLNVESGVYFGLDAVGTRILRLLEQGIAEEEIVGTLLEEYEVERSVLEADVSAFLSQLRAKGLLRELDG